MKASCSEHSGNSNSADAQKGVLKPECACTSPEGSGDKKTDSVFQVGPRACILDKLLGDAAAAAAALGPYFE